MNIEDAMPCHEMSLNSTFLILKKKKEKRKKEFNFLANSYKSETQRELKQP